MIKNQTATDLSYSMVSCTNRLLPLVTPTFASAYLKKYAEI